MDWFHLILALLLLASVFLNVELFCLARCIKRGEYKHGTDDVEWIVIHNRIDNTTKWNISYYLYFVTLYYRGFSSYIRFVPVI